MTDTRVLWGMVPADFVRGDDDARPVLTIYLDPDFVPIAIVVKARYPLAACYGCAQNITDGDIVSADGWAGGRDTKGTLKRKFAATAGFRHEVGHRWRCPTLGCLNRVGDVIYYCPDPKHDAITGSGARSRLLKSRSDQHALCLVCGWKGEKHPRHLALDSWERRK